MGSHEFGDDRVQLVVVGDPVRVGAEARIVDQLRLADGAEQALGHRLHGGRQGDIATILGGVDIARRGMLRPRAGARRHLAGQFIVGRLRPNDGMDGIKNRHVDHLAAAAADLDRARRHHHRESAIKAGDIVGQGDRWQNRRPVSVAIAGGETAHRFDQTAETGLVSIDPGLSPTGHAHNN